MRRILSMPLTFLVLLVQSTWLALGQIRANKMRAALTTIGIVIGVASVTAVIAALTGLKTKVLSEFESFGTNSIFIQSYNPRKGPMRWASWHKIRLKPEEFDDLLEHCPSVEMFSFASWDSKSVGFAERTIESVTTRGINANWHKIESRDVTIGRPFSIVDEEHARQVCLISPEVQTELRLDRDPTGQIIVLGGRSFRVIGMVEEQSWLQGGGNDTGEVFIPFETAWKLWRPWMGVLCRSKSPEVSEEAQAEIKFYMRNKRRIKPGEEDTFRIQAIEEILSQFNKISLIITAIAGGIVGISLLVGGIGIMNIMLVSVSERTREIGLRKAVGARPSAIMLQFLVEAIVLCLFGGLMGLGVAQLLTMAITNIPKAQLEQAHIPLWAVGLSFGFSAVVGVFFGMFPAIKAARLDPIEALRHE